MEELTGRPPVEVRGDWFRHRPATQNDVRFDFVKHTSTASTNTLSAFALRFYFPFSEAEGAASSQDFPRAKPCASSVSLEDPFLAKKRFVLLFMLNSLRNYTANAILYKNYFEHSNSK